MTAPSSFVGISAILLLIAGQMDIAEARPGGGGLRGSGSMSMGSRGGGGSMNRGGGASRAGSGASRSGGSYSRPGGGSYTRPATRPGTSTSGRAAAGAQGAGQRTASSDRTAGGGRSERQASRADNQSGRQDNRGDRQDNRGDRQTDRGDRTTNIDNSINISGNDFDGWGGDIDYPIAAGIAIGTVAGITAAAWGSAFYALPGGCSPYPYAGYSYYNCGGAYYQPQYEGDTVVYVTVPPPGETTKTTVPAPQPK